MTEIPLIKTGDDIGKLLLDSINEQDVDLEDGDVLVISQTVISKSEGNVVDLSSVEPSSRALEVAEKINKDPKKVEVILNQTEEIVRLSHVLISETRHGFICADAGVDDSNVESGKVTILPEDPDASAERIRRILKEETGAEAAVIVADSWGRPFRLGAVGFAIGVAGMKPLKSLKGKEDAYGTELETTTVAPPDSFAAAASLEMGESDEEVPAVLFKEVSYEAGDGSVDNLLRSRENDLFR